MADKMYYLLVFLLCISGKVYCDVLCEDGFCRNYSFETGCAAAASECRINNATHTGLWLPSPTICNCCQYCLPFIGEGKHCSPGGPGLGTTVGRCGHGLTCLQASDGDYYCNRMNTTCHREQDKYDERHLSGETGALEERPRCDGKGDYAAFSCVPTQSCFCQSQEGKRIFGEVLYTGASTERNMHCGCSRLHEKIRKNIAPGVPFPVVGPRCTSDGNFHPIQCVGRICYCVDKITGEILDANHRRVDLDVQPITRLDCYDSELDPHPHQSVGKAPFNVTTPCLERMDDVIEQLQKSVEDGYIVDFFSSAPSCLPDWSFGRISIRNGTRICVDGRAQRIGDYEAEPGTTEYDTMDCKCAYTREVIMANSIERPVCCPNGTFRPVQCRRGRCYCVDADGRQDGVEVEDPSLLSCYTPGWKTCAT